jgi:hypothetical protein
MLYLTYNNQGHQDGPGAQIIRILGIYSLALNFGCSYIHSPILVAEHCDANMKDRWNQFVLKLIRPQHMCTVSSIHIVHTEIERPTIEEIQMKMKSYMPTLMRILYPFEITDTRPHIFYNLHYKTETMEDVITVHIRRGDAQCIPFRCLPDDYYVDTMKAVRSESDQPMRFHVYSDSPITLDVDDCTYFINTDPIESVEMLSRGRVFIMSVSAFSILAAYMCRGRVIAPPRYSHPPLPHWTPALVV